MQLPEQPITGFRETLKGGDVPQEFGPDASLRFNVYRNNVAMSLCRALAQRFPVVQRLLGPDYFMALSAEFIAAHPPRLPVLMYWGNEFATFLDQFPPLSAYPYLGDVARIEYARGTAFHAADHRPISVERLNQINPETDCLHLHPSVQVLRLQHPAVTIWQRREGDTGKIPFGPEVALILRDRGFDVPVHKTDPASATFLEAISMGQALLDATFAAQEIDEDFDPQPLLVLLMQAGVLI